MRNIRLTIAYDGTNYNGWQRQPQQLGIGVENALTEALTKLCKEPVELFGAGRTDSGVHAVGQVANFHTSCPIPAESLPVALLQYLPDDIRVVEAADVDENWHARYNACGKEYRYTVALGRHGVFNSNYAWFLNRKPDMDKMKRGAEMLVGTHDFSAFRAVGSSAKSTVRTIESFEINYLPADENLLHFQQMPDMITFDVRGGGFLYKQVRLMVGALVNLGVGTLDEQRFADAIAHGGNIIAAPAPACGLVLKKVLYPAHIL